MSEAQLVAATGVLAFILVLPGLIALIMEAGLMTGLGNRETVPPFPEWANRANRAQRNMVDTLVPFLAVVIAAQMAGVSNETTRLGMALFFGGRLAHAITYIAGIPYLRTIAFLVSVSGMMRIASEILPIAGPVNLVMGLFG